MNKDLYQNLKEKALKVRRDFLTIASNNGALHIGSSLSQIDILVAIYGYYLDLEKIKNGDEDRDRFILSKGHAALGYYVTLSEFGFIPFEEVMTYGKDNTKLAAHPVLGSALGIEASSGALGHGLPIGLGMAIAAKTNNWKSKYVVLLSDGECDEGSNWEAILFAGHRKADNLVVVVDYNKIQSFGTVKEILDLEPFADKWRACNWNVKEVDGHNFEEIIPALESIEKEKTGKPTVIIAHTIKGKGISYMENTLDWHYLNLKPENLEAALKELI